MSTLFGLQSQWFYGQPAAARRASEADFAAAGAPVTAGRPWLQVPEKWLWGGAEDNSRTTVGICQTLKGEGKSVIAVLTPVQRNGRAYATWAALNLPPNMGAVTTYVNKLCDKFAGLLDFVELINEPLFGAVYWSGSPQQLLDTYNTAADVFDQRGVKVLTPSYNGTDIVACQQWIAPFFGRAAGIALHPYVVHPAPFLQAVQAQWPLPIYITELGSHTSFHGPAQWAADRATAMAECAAVGCAAVIDFPSVKGSGIEGPAGIVDSTGKRLEPYYSALKNAAAAMGKVTPSPPVVPPVVVPPVPIPPIVITDPAPPAVDPSEASPIPVPILLPPTIIVGNDQSSPVPPVAPSLAMIDLTGKVLGLADGQTMLAGYGLIALNAPACDAVQYTTEACKLAWYEHKAPWCFGGMHAGIPMGLPPLCPIPDGSHVVTAIFLLAGSVVTTATANVIFSGY